MKYRSILLAALLAVVALGQNTPAHSAIVTWTDTLNPTGTTYNVYRAAGACPATPPTSTTGFTKLNPNAAASGLTYVDSSIVSGTYSYLVTAVVGGVETAPSPCGQGTVPIAGVPPQSIKIAIK